MRHPLRRLVGAFGALSSVPAVVLGLCVLLALCALVAVAVPGAVTPAVAAPAGRGYELVTPADKAGSGMGVGLQPVPEDAQPSIGIAARTGSRYVAPSTSGMLTDGTLLYFTDYALSGRGGDSVGWESRPLATHRDYGPTGGALTSMSPAAASGDLGRIAVAPIGAYLFPEMADWPASVTPDYLRDWEGRYDEILPKTPGQVAGIPLVSEDGTHVILQGKIRGALGAGDPTVDVTSASANTLYDDDVSAPLADTFAGSGVLSGVGVCTGTGADRTQIPLRTDLGKQSAQACPDPAPGREASLISPLGAAVSGGSVSLPSTREHILSDDGRRLVFYSPDPLASGSPTACAVATGAATSCPAQLYLRVRNDDGTFATRWISRSVVPDQDASLMAKVAFEGATPDGSKLFFRTNAPLTADDPNGTAAAPVTTGTPSVASWDLYEYDVPAAPADPGSGTLTRLTAGPLGTGDPNASVAGAPASLRFLSADGNRAYFVTASPIPGVPTNDAPTDGTSTVAGGTPTNTATVNLYAYDATKPLTDRWEFVALLPRTTGIATCATVGGLRAEPLANGSNGFNGSNGNTVIGAANCVRGTDDGGLITFLTPGKLTADADDVSGVVDLWAFNARRDRLVRVTASQGGAAGGTYACVAAGSVQCAGDSGFSGGNGNVESRVPQLGMVTQPHDPDDRAVYFQSKSQLVPEDHNHVYDVYAWNPGSGADAGTLSLISTGAADAAGAYYAGNNIDGSDVYFETKDALTWQDVDTVMDVYDARAGGGIPEPPPAPAPCAGPTCQGPLTPAPGPPLVGSVSSTEDGNVHSVPASVGVSKSKVVTGRAATLKVRVLDAGWISVAGSSIRRKSVSASKAGLYSLRIVLNARARQSLKAKSTLRVGVRVAFRAKDGRLASKTVSVTFKQPKAKRAKAKRGGRR